jgi:hypothetical protein
MAALAASATVMAMDPWTKPEIEDIRMSAEIGGYQPDGDDRDNEPVLAPEERLVPPTAPAGETR